MHIEIRSHSPGYARYLRKKELLLTATLALLAVSLVVSLSLGSVAIPLTEVVKTLAGTSESVRWNTIVFDIRCPRVLTALAAGAGLAASGTVMQSILRNPLASPFTLGISQAAAFGAALSIMGFGSGVVRSTGLSVVVFKNPYATTVSAFCCCLAATGVLLGISRSRRASPEVMVLSGVALGSLFSAGTMFLHCFADEVQLSAMVFWAFGDVGRTSWRELTIMAAVAGASSLFFYSQRWRYNALDSGDETAKSLGVAAERVRGIGMVVASLATSAIIAFTGIIGFVGLICPHIMRRLVGNDHRFLFPGACLAGGVVLVTADTAARLLLIPHVFPVAILTSFLGVPVFMYLIMRGYRR
ncbi:FecCD family ABC transporter permease [Myxococcota bacterium]